MTSTPPTRATRRATRPRGTRKRCNICTNTRSTRPRGRHRPSSRVIARAIINPAPLIDVGLGFTRVPTHPRRRDDRAKDGLRERTHRERLHLFDDSVRLRRGEDDGAARGGGRTRGGGLRASGFARARRRSVSRSIRLSVRPSPRARALKTRGDDEENIHRATSARARVDRVARRVARTSSHAVRARSGSRARRRPFAARVTLAARGRGRSRARERESSKMDAPWRPC